LRRVPRCLPAERQLELLFHALERQRAAREIAPRRRAPDVLGMELRLGKTREIEPFRAANGAVDVAAFHIGARHPDTHVKLSRLGLVRVEAKAGVEVL